MVGNSEARTRSQEMLPGRRKDMSFPPILADLSTILPTKNAYHCRFPRIGI
jgi:hypothetical protein